MIYQQYKTAIKQAYADDSSVAEVYIKAKACREWLESLRLEAKLRGPMVEPVAAIEEALKGLLPDS
jgi:hypothetical protein